MMNSQPPQSSAASSTPGRILSVGLQKRLNEYYGKPDDELDQTLTPTVPTQASLPDSERSGVPKPPRWTVEGNTLMIVPAYLQNGNYILHQASHPDSVIPEVFGTRSQQPSACFTIERDDNGNLSYKTYMYLEPSKEGQNPERVELLGFKIVKVPDEDPGFVRLFGHEESAASWSGVISGTQWAGPGKRSKESEFLQTMQTDFRGGRRHPRGLRSLTPYQEWST